MDLKKRFTPARGVSNMELFYDLIFVYCISVITGVLHHPQGGFFGLETYALYATDLLTILQVWFFTTILQNRYGDGGAFDNICLIINMFLLFIMAGCVGEGWRNTMLTWNLVWAFVLVDILVHWGIKRLRYQNLDEVDTYIMDRTMLVLGVQAVLALAAAFVPWEVGQWISLVAFAFGWLAFVQGGRFARKPARFDHLAERCSLLVIVTFGETIVGIAGFMEGNFDVVFALLVFALVVGLFLVYFFVYDHMLDHDSCVAGVDLMLLTAWLVFVVSNITVALEYVPDAGVMIVPKGLYLVLGLSAYLLSSLMMLRYNKVRFRLDASLVCGRIAACGAIAAAGLVSGFDPLVTVVSDVVVVWLALAHEWLYYRLRTDSDGGLAVLGDKG